MVKEYEPSHNDDEDNLDRCDADDALNGESVCPGESQGSDGKNAGAIEDIDDIDDDSVQRIFVLLTQSLSQQFRLLNRNVCSIQEETFLQDSIPEGDHEGNGAGRADKENSPGPDGCDTICGVRGNAEIELDI